MRPLNFAFVLLLTGCSSLNPANWFAYHLEVQQGNLLTQDAVDKLKLGMTRGQVRFLLGTPLLADPFHSERWDYKYQLYSDDKLTKDALLTLTFNGDNLVKIEGSGPDKVSPTASAPVSQTPKS